VSRTADGEISIVLNVCAHRGMELCWADRGNASSFKCPYHGWVFDGSGQLLGAPFEREMYGDWDKSQFGLRTVRTALRHGLVFGTFDDEAPSFTDWLGDIGWYFDEMYGRGGDWEMAVAPERLVLSCNWKYFTDNFSGDTYHVATLHNAMVELGMMDGDSLRFATDLVKATEPARGHLVLCTGTWDADSTRRYDFERVVEFSSLFFPATFGSSERSVPTPDGGEFPACMISPATPKGPGTFEWSRLYLVPKGTPAAWKKLGNFLVGGEIATQADDWAAWQSMQRAATREIGRTATAKYNGMPEHPNKPEGWPGPGHVYAGLTRDESQWQFWLHWFAMMTADEG
jgi:nitrite reductase/ring-hydroxylating ferredoxin subunit